MSVEWREGSRRTLFFSFPIFFFLGRCGRLQMRSREEEAAACLGKLLMHARFNPRFPIPDIIGSEGEEQPTGIDLKSADSAAHSRKPN